jgi:type II restriction/modification system DNA methylase subunit YeeA
MYSFIRDKKNATIIKILFLFIIFFAFPGSLLYKRELKTIKFLYFLLFLKKQSGINPIIIFY